MHYNCYINIVLCLIFKKDKHPIFMLKIFHTTFIYIAISTFPAYIKEYIETVVLYVYLTYNIWGYPASYVEQSTQVEHAPRCKHQMENSTIMSNVSSVFLRVSITNGACMMLRCKHNMYIARKYKIDLYSPRNGNEKLTRRSFLFLKLTQLNVIFSDNVRILYIFSTNLYIAQH